MYNKGEQKELVLQSLRSSLVLSIEVKPYLTCFLCLLIFGHKLCCLCMDPPLSVHVLQIRVFCDNALKWYAYEKTEAGDTTQLALLKWLVFVSFFRLLWGPYESKCVVFETVINLEGMCLNMCVCLCLYVFKTGSWDPLARLLLNVRTCLFFNWKFLEWRSVWT